MPGHASSLYGSGGGAFDPAPHEGITYKLTSMGVTNTTLAQVKDWVLIPSGSRNLQINVIPHTIKEHHKALYSGSCSSTSSLQTSIFLTKNTLFILMSLPLLVGQQHWRSYCNTFKRLQQHRGLGDHLGPLHQCIQKGSRVLHPQEVTTITHSTPEWNNCLPHQDTFPLRAATGKALHNLGHSHE